MTDVLLATQQAIFTALTVNGGVQTVLGASPTRLYDHVPPDAVFPYAILSHAHVRPYDTHSERGFEQILTLDIFSRYRGGKEARGIFQALYDVLHRATLSISGAVFLSSEFHSADFTLTDDGLTYHATVRFSVIVQTN